MLLLVLVVLGLFCGILSGLFGVGGGVILVPALVLIARLDAHTAIGVSLAVIVPTAIVGACKHYTAGHFDLTTVLIVSVGGVVGAYLGAGLAASVPELALRRAFGVLIVVLGCNMIFDWSGTIMRNAQHRPDASGS